MKQLIILALSLFFLSSLLKAQTIDNCLYCDEYELTETELEGKSMEELALLRNEIYARNGYVFQSGIYNAYFKYQPCVRIDNGYLIRGYEAHFTENEVRIETGDYAHSEIFGDFYDGYSDYMSENEYSYFWTFEIREEGIVFKYFSAAG